METSLTNGVHQLWEYLLVVEPDQNVCDRIEAEKKRFLSIYKPGVRAELKSRIMIAGFKATESMEGTVIRWIHRICSQYKSFLVTLNNYSGFPTHTVYVRIQDHTPFKQLAAQLHVIDDYVQSSGCPEARFVHRPHLSIASGLTDDVYNNAMPDYSKETLHERFLAEGLVLLKRNNSFEPYKQVNVFRFYPPDTNTYEATAQQLKHEPI